MPKHILILEDQPDCVAMLMRAARASLGEVQMTVATSLVSVRAMAAQTALTPFDYALVDMRLPDGLSIEWLAQFKCDYPGTVAIVTSLYDDDDLVFAALRVGADGYLLKGDGDEQLEHALKKMLQGEHPISPAIARKLMSQFRTSTTQRVGFLPGPVPAQSSGLSADKLAQSLTAREEDVLALIGGGLMIKQVAVKLGIGYHTVNDNIKTIYRKLGINTRAQAATEASRRGLL
jgi:two-component system nitrate/nitrite response regulator NarL